MGHDVFNDVGDGDNGNKDAGNNADKGDGGDAGGEGGGARRMRRWWRRQQGWRRWRRLHIAGVVESVTFQFKKISAKEWKRSHKSKRVLCYIS